MNASSVKVKFWGGPLHGKERHVDRIMAEYLAPKQLHPPHLMVTGDEHLPHEPCFATVRYRLVPAGIYSNAWDQIGIPEEYNNLWDWRNRGMRESIPNHT